LTDIDPFGDAAARSPTPPRHRLDDLDRSIIQLLQKDGRSSNTDIAKALDVTETTIRKRIARLLADGVISIVAIPLPEAMEPTMSAIIGLSVRLGSLRELSSQLRSQPEIRYVGLSSGRYDVMVEAFFHDHEHLLEFITERLGTLEGIISVETSIILKVVKFSYEWEMPT
jgi:Lrp/AsnC family transcriptional regulator, regulator for asnA, asnC and gidA